MDNFFGEYGIFSGMMPVMDAEKKKTSPKTEKKQESNKTETKVVVEKFKAPMKIYFDSVASVEISEDNEFTKDEIFEKITKLSGINFFEEHRNSFSLKSLKGEKYILRPLESTKYDKGSAGKHLLYNELQSVEPFKENDDEEASTDSIIKGFKNETGLDISLYLIDDVYIPVASLKTKDNLKEMKFPVKVSSLTMFGETIEIESSDYETFLEKKEEEDSLIPVEDTKIEVSEAILKKVLCSLLPEYSMDLEFNYYSDQNFVQVMHKPISSSGTSVTPAVKKEETYPTNAVVTLFFTKYQLSPELFNDKKEITKKELLNFLRKKGHIEYSAERTEIRYEKKENIIIPLVKSAKRGYSLEDNEDYRKEESDLMTISVNKNSIRTLGCQMGSVDFHLPKIPFYILKEVIHFFWDMYVFKNTEAAAMIYYNKSGEEYEIYYPEQNVSHASVEFLKDERRELDSNLYSVMEIHSHGSFDAFWSGQDNADEIDHRLYAVIGDLKNFKYDDKHIKVRAATGGYHVRVKVSDIFEPLKSIEEFHCAMKRVHF